MARGKGEGSVFYSNSHQLWEGRIELPHHELKGDGTPKRRWKTIRRKDKAELIRELNKAKRLLETTGDLPTASMTVDKWFDYWVREIAVKTRRPATMNSYRSIITRNILPALGKKRLEKVTVEDVRRLINNLERNHSAATTIRNTFSVLSAALNDAEAEGRIVRNPCAVIDPPKKSKPVLEVLDRDEVRRILTSLHGPDKYLWATFMLTGARRGEVIGLEWDRIGDTEIDLSWQLQRIIWSHGCGPRPKVGEAARCGYKRAASCPDKHLELPRDYEHRHIEGGLYWTRPKSSAGWRIIPLVDPLRGWLREWRSLAPSNPHGLVFADGDRPIDPDDASRIWPDVRKDLGIRKRVRLHDLRHTAIDMMYEAKAPEADIIRIFGHSTVQMSRSYRSAGNRVREAEAMRSMSAGLGFLELE